MSGREIKSPFFREKTTISSAQGSLAQTTGVHNVPGEHLAAQVIFLCGDSSLTLPYVRY